ncbi:esterase [Methylopila jiangsuensis]|uniref:Esterase n=1 Tax=Methylopila jiangsuensis TaxID=586230 RepID=A0A9W6JHM0_9HYPH|nr:alpha/beta hydrolase family protein [Methylopila jiangsuensis]MDR6286464.1 enterochelin esterase family protein [Methylopila jiangsuensis]GLK77197.1 esterase [Methylopila jiangsuensis]
MTPQLSLLASLVAASVLSFGAAPAASGVVERNLTAPSPALGKPIRYSLYRPATPPTLGQRWPVLYLLHGGGPGEADWLDAGGLAATMDRAISDGRMPPTVVVMPQAGNSWYVDNTDIGGEGAMETALTRDLVAAIDARLPTAACREGRAVAGLSMGGYGALLFAFDKPGRYGYAISLSGSITQPIAPQMTQRLKRARTFYDGAFGAPFDVKRFNRWNLFPKARRLALRRHKPDVYLNAGDRDPGGIVQGSTEMHLALLRAGVDSKLTVAPGRHEWALWRRELGPALDWLGTRIDPTCGASGVAAAPTTSTQ